MASWVSHFRIAQALLEQGFDFHRQMFVMGNIAPDAGVWHEDKQSYVPNKIISHWYNDAGNMEPERFYKTYLSERPTDDKTYGFLMGYYCHIFADLEWVLNIWRPKKETSLYAEQIEKDPNFAGEIKKDWFGLDFLYLQEHPDSIFYTDFVHIESVPDYLPNFPQGAFTNRAKDTKAFYLNEPDWDLDRPYIYLNREEWDTYVNETIKVISEALRDKV